MKSSARFSVDGKSLLLDLKSVNQRRKLWLEISGAMYEMCYNPLYYNRIIEEKLNTTSKFTKQIEKDLHRTFPGEIFFKTAEGKETLQRILVAYSWRNPNVGYCQGMNFIAGFFLILGFSELETFWLLVQVVEKYLPFEYYSTMNGVMIDQKIFDYLLRTRLPKISRAMDKLEMNSSLITVQWFICIYAYTFQKEVVTKIWDEFFYYGYSIIYKISLAVFWLARSEIPKKKDLTDVVFCIEKKCKDIADPESFFKTVNKKLFRISNFLLEKLKEASVKEVNKELNERYDNIMSKTEILNRISVSCNDEDECKQKHDHTSDYFTFMAEPSIDIDEDYIDFQSYNNYINASLLRESEKLLIGVKNHVCMSDSDDELAERIVDDDIRSSFVVISEDVKEFDRYFTKKYDNQL